jgi:hypothetical protein
LQFRKQLFVTVLLEFRMPLSITFDYSTNPASPYNQEFLNTLIHKLTSFQTGHAMFSGLCNKYNAVSFVVAMETQPRADSKLRINWDQEKHEIQLFYPQSYLSLPEVEKIELVFQMTLNLLGVISSPGHEAQNSRHLLSYQNKEDFLQEMCKREYVTHFLLAYAFREYYGFNQNAPKLYTATAEMSLDSFCEGCFTNVQPLQTHSLMDHYSAEYETKMNAYESKMNKCLDMINSDANAFIFRPDLLTSILQNADSGAILGLGDQTLSVIQAAEDLQVIMSEVQQLGSQEIREKFQLEYHINLALAAKTCANECLGRLYLPDDLPQTLEESAASILRTLEQVNSQASQNTQAIPGISLLQPNPFQFFANYRNTSSTTSSTVPNPLFS